jgi:hypothetical protein
MTSTWMPVSSNVSRTSRSVIDSPGSIAPPSSDQVSLSVRWISDNSTAGVDHDGVRRRDQAVRCRGGRIVVEVDAAGQDGDLIPRAPEELSRPASGLRARRVCESRCATARSVEPVAGYAATGRCGVGPPPPRRRPSNPVGTVGIEPTPPVCKFCPFWCARIRDVQERSDAVRPQLREFAAVAASVVVRRQPGPGARRAIAATRAHRRADRAERWPVDAASGHGGRGWEPPPPKAQT